MMRHPGWSTLLGWLDGRVSLISHRKCVALDCGSLPGTSWLGAVHGRQLLRRLTFYRDVWITSQYVFRLSSVNARTCSAMDASIVRERGPGVPV